MTARTLRGPAVPERELLMVKAYELSAREEWFEAADHFAALLKQPNIAPYDRGRFLSRMATCLMNVGRAREAAEANEAAFEIRPEKRDLLEQLIFCRDHCEDTTAAEAYRLRRKYWNLVKPAARRYNDETIDREPERRLRVGYVSGDFRYHSANAAFSLVLLRHSPAVEVFCYNSAPPMTRWDDYTTIYSQETTLRLIDGITDETAADIIRRDRIDILVDLAAYTNGGRLGIFALKPAPVQVTAWGYILGTGLDTVDAIFGDPITMPLSDQDVYAERIVHLPSIVPFVGNIKAPEPTIQPCLKGQPFTFGVFCRPAKIGEYILPLWSEILKAVPSSRILFKDAWVGKPYHRERILKALNVEPSRVLFEGHTEYFDHLAAWGRVDLALDPYPIAGGTSMLEALWQGVPGLIRRAPPGARVVSTVGLSAETILGLDDFIADTDEEYVGQAVGWATVGQHTLAQWRLRLRDKVLLSPLAQGYVEAVEDAYRELWRGWCKG